MAKGWHGDPNGHRLAAMGIRMKSNQIKRPNNSKFNPKSYNYDYYDAESTRRKAICKYVMDTGGKDEAKKIDAMKGIIRHFNGRMNLSKKMNPKASKIYAADADYVRGMLGRAEKRMTKKMEADGFFRDRFTKKGRQERKQAKNQAEYDETIRGFRQAEQDAMTSMDRTQPAEYAKPRAPRDEPIAVMGHRPETMNEPIERKRDRELVAAGKNEKRK